MEDKASRDVVMSFRVTASERQAIRDAAEMVKRTDSDMIRLIVSATCDELKRQKPQAAPGKGEPPEAPG